VKVLDLPQGSDEWKAARAGRVTASRIADVIATIKAGEAAARRDYRAQLVAEILTGTPQEDGYINAEMQHGIDTEPMARSAYELAKGSWVEQVGFVLHPQIERAGASPDGLVGKDGLVEIKCPKTATHLQYLVDGAVPTKYQPQMLWQMACTERAFCDFVSFDPRLPEEMQLFVARLKRDDKRIKELEGAVGAFLADVDKMLETVRRFA
jgi:putative phage-type endonuclease